jgi:hypothetical protein
MARDRKLSAHFVMAVILASCQTLAAFGPSDSEYGLETCRGPGSYRILGEDTTIRFPFDIYRGDIRFRAEVNGHPVRLLLDDGFMWDPLLFWGGPDAEALELERDGTIMVGDEGDETALASDTASGITVRLPGVEFLNQTAVITPESSGNSRMWEGSVGQVSATFFKHFVVDINFDSMMITLIEPDQFRYRARGSAVPWKPLEIGAWSIPGTIIDGDGREISLELMMDLGYNLQAQIATGGEHEFEAPEGAVPGSLGFNIQGQETRGHIGRVAGIVIGGYEVKDVAAAFVLGEHTDHTFHEVMIGLGLLSRFNLVFDASRNRLFVEPNTSFADPFD